MNNPKQLFLDVKIDKKKTLDSFISCDSTKVVLRALKEFCEEDSINQFLFLWGKPGVGKNYLLHSVHQEFLLKERTAAYISFKKTNISSEKILDNLSTLDLIILEGIEEYPLEDTWEVAFFNLINQSRATGTKILCSSKKVAKSIDFSLPDLVSRVLSFSAFELTDIKDEEKREALKNTILRKGLNADENVISYILNHTSRGLTDLLTLISDLDSFSLEKKRRITIPLIKEMLSVN